MKNLFKKKQADSGKDYYKHASEWSMDQHGMLKTRLYQNKCALLTSAILNCLLVITVMILATNQTLVPMLVHHYGNGVVTVEAVENENKPKKLSQVESDLARFVINRESYDISSYRYQFNLVGLLSNRDVASEYENEHDKYNDNSPINILGAKASRSVSIKNINFLDKFIDDRRKKKGKSSNLAEVVFSVTDQNKFNHKETTKYYSSVISWRYMQPSENPAERWQNFDGFQVTRYTKQIRND